MFIVSNILIYIIFILLKISYLQPYFKVTTDEVLQRILYSLIPFNIKFYDISTGNPDLYGPFWIFTCLIFILSASGSLSRIIQGSKVTSFFQTFVPTAAALIYGIGFLAPFIMVIIMRCFGAKNSYISALCIYGYSYSIFIPVFLLCASGYTMTQLVLLIYGFFQSTSFILVNYWKELGKYVDKLRFIIILLIIICQSGLFFTLKLYFFQKFEEEVSNNNVMNSLNQTSTK